MIKSFINRVNGRLKYTYNRFRDDLHFSFNYACFRTLDELGGRVGLKRISAWAHDKKDQWIINHLNVSLAPIIEKYQNNCNCGTSIPNSPIWVCWWTGEETAPLLIKQCIHSIRCNSGSHPVNLITQSNYKEYLNIPTHIIQKVNDGTMCLANFSDYLRFSLLATYGGLWLDATIFCRASLPDEYFTAPIFTCKGIVGTGKYISNYRWTSFCFGGYSGHLLFKYMQDAFDEYWKKHSVAIDYLLVDYIIATAYNNIPAIRQDLDSVPINNPQRDMLQEAMNAGLPASQFDTVVQQETWIYKLSWRETYNETATDGTQSVYGHFIHSDICSRIN